MRGINKMILMGLVGADPVLAYTPAGVPLCKLSIATHRFQKKKDSEEREQITDWHNIVVWDRSGEDLAKLVKKGDVLYVEGELRVRRWKNERSGESGCSIEVIASEWERAPNRGEEIVRDPNPTADAARAELRKTTHPKAEPAPAAAPAAEPVRDVRAAAAGDDSFDDDDIPF